jgi:hypothetical protein
MGARSAPSTTRSVGRVGAAIHSRRHERPAPRRTGAGRLTVEAASDTDERRHPGVRLPGLGGRKRPSPFAPGTLVVVEAGTSTAHSVNAGERLVVGRDPAAGIVLADPSVALHHTLIERLGPGWLVSGLDAGRVTWLLDATGRAQPIEGQLGLRSGELLIGNCQVLLYPPPESRP